MSSSVVPRALELQAALFPRKEEGVLTGRQMAERIAGAFPQAVIDWQRGDRVTQAKIELMTQWRVPEVLIAPVRSQFGKVPHISVEFAEWPGYVASLCEFRIEGGLGDAIHLDTQPPDLAFVHHAARAIGDALDCDYLLSSSQGAEGIECRTTRGGVTDAVAFVREQFGPDFHTGLRATKLTDWKGAVREAVLDWLARYEHRDRVAKTLAGFASAEAYADALVAELAEIGPVRRIWSITSDAPRHHDLLLDHGAWTTLLDVGGVEREG